MFLCFPVENLHGNMHVFVLSFENLHGNMHVFVLSFENLHGNVHVFCAFMLKIYMEMCMFFVLSC